MTADDVTSRPGTASPEVTARVGLAGIVEPDDAPAMALVHAVGPRAVWSAVLGGHALESSGKRHLPAGAQTVVDRLRKRAPSPDAQVHHLAAAAALGARVLCPGDPEWPDALDVLGAERPLCLWVRGVVDLSSATARAVAVVGSRAATGYGVHVAGELGYDLAAEGWTVVSGGAYGVDGAAHRGALAANGVTVAVLAGGVDVVYPRGHATLFDRIRAGGAVVSEWPPGSPPLAHRFLVRNRVIAGLSSGTVVVEAAARSGAARTAGDAAKYGREVMAVPGPVTSPMSVGCHELLRSGATCVRSAADVVEAVTPLGEWTVSPSRGPDRPRDALPDRLRRTLEAVPAGTAGATAVSIAEAGRQPLEEVRRSLAALEVGGFVERHDGGFRLATSGRTTSRA
jgi:DNA processing protein